MSSERSQASSTASNRLKRFEENARTLASAKPESMKAFWSLHKETMAAGALDAKTKELIALAISVTSHCDDCIALHTAAALAAGASTSEVTDTLGVAVLMGGGTGLVYATHAVEALDQLSDSAQ